MRRSWQKLLLVVLSLAACFAGLELLLRATDAPTDPSAGRSDSTIDAPWDDRGGSPLHVRSSNRRLVYELRPDADVWVERFGRRFRTNSAGFRDAPFATAKPPGSSRILVVGDSVTFGWNLAEGERYTDLLERRFREAGREVEVFNMGVGGYNAIQEVEVVRTRALGFDPDLLVVGYVLNDDEVGADAGLWRHFSRSRSRVWDLLALRLERLGYRFGRGVTERAFAELSGLARAHDLPVLVVIFPVLLLSPNGKYPHRAVHEEVARLAELHGFRVLDLLDAYRGHGFAALSNGDVVHPNAAGHRLAADELYRLLEKGAAGGAWTHR